MTVREPQKRQSFTRKDRIEAFEITTKIARQMLEEQRLKRAAKTERLRRARLGDGTEQNDDEHSVLDN